MLAARRRARRAWGWYAAGLVPFVLAIALVVFVVWRTSEIRAVHIRTSSQSATALPAGALPPRLGPAWHSTDRLAAGAPVWLDVVVTYSQRTVTGRDARTGAPRWSYTRSDRRVCSAIEENGVVMALYAHDGNCDEATGLDAVSGSRRWVRTLFVNGTNLAVSAISGQILLSNPSMTTLIEPTGGLDWWFEAQPAGCRTSRVLLGTAGVLLASSCGGSKDTLSLRGVNSAKNRDWSLPLDGRVPLAADDVVAVLRSDGRAVQLLDRKGRRTTTSRLPGVLAGASTPSAHGVTGARAEVMSVGGDVVAIQAGDGRLLWQRALPALPTDTSDGLLIAARARVETLSPFLGRVTRTTPAPSLQPGDRLARLGHGVVAGNAAGTTAFT